MLNSISKLFKQLLEGHDLTNQHKSDPNLAIACLLCEVAGADHQIERSEVKAKQLLIGRLLGLDRAQAQALLSRAEAKVTEAASLYEFTTQLRELTQETRYNLIQAMWEVAHADGEIDPQEDAVIRKSAELLYVDHYDFIRAKLSITEEKE